MRYGRENNRAQGLQQEVARAEADYQRLRAAYLEVARNEPGHEVALAMIGADMDRAHAALQALIGLPRLPFTHEPSTVVRREAQRLTLHFGDGPLNASVDGVTAPKPVEPKRRRPYIPPQPGLFDPAED